MLKILNKGITMNIKKWITIAASIVMIPVASATIITFDGLDNGTILDNEYFSDYGITFNATNVDLNLSNLAVVFDSSLNNTNDSDLESPFSNSNLGISNPGNILIIHENASSCDEFTCANPDDEGSRPGGFFTIDFTESVILNSIDFFDIENEEATQNNAIQLFANNGDELNVGVFFTPGTGGDNTWDRLNFDIVGVSSLKINLNGSGAISNLNFTSVAVPEPSMLVVLTLALVGFAGARCKR